MEKILNLETERFKRRRSKSAESVGAAAGVLLHSIINELTLIHMGCAKLEKALGREWDGQEHPDIGMIERSALKIGRQINTLRFHLEGTGGVRAKTGRPDRKITRAPSTDADSGKILSLPETLPKD